jgi:hypothetical protein
MDECMTYGERMSLIMNSKLLQTSEELLFAYSLLNNLGQISDEDLAKEIRTTLPRLRTVRTALLGRALLFHVEGGRYTLNYVLLSAGPKL